MPLTTRTVQDWFDALQEAPATSLGDILGPGGLLVIAPHPDDETLGCGALIAAASAAGLPVRVAVLTDGAASHPRSAAYPGPRLAALREQETRDALVALGAAGASLRFLRHSDGRLKDTDPDAVAAALEADLHTSNAALFVTWDGDPHPDHKAAFAIARLLQARTGLPLHAYPIWSRTLPGGALLTATGERMARFNARPYLAAKRRAMAAHRSQVFNLVHDDPTGFRLTPDLLDLFMPDHEAFIAAPG